MVPPLLLVAGPTASGKSALALALAERLGGTVINADSMQVYRELRILSARPGVAEEARVPHALYGVLPLAEPCSAGRWRALAVAAIAAARGHGRVPIVVGGTGLYLRALTQGLAPVPAIPAPVRAAVGARFTAIGRARFQTELAGRDRAAASLAPGDTQRLLRAAEVLAATGRTLGEWQAEERDPPPAGAIFRLLVMPERSALYAACEARFDAMLAAGALEETRAVQALGLDPALPGMRALGLRPLLAHLAGTLTLAAASAGAKTETRRYAKRQLTWFRHQFQADLAQETPDAEGVLRALARGGLY